MKPSNACGTPKKHDFDGVLLVGPDRLIHSVGEKIPYPLVSSVVVIHENLGRTSPRELQRRLQPLVDSHEQEQQLSDVKLLEASERGAVTNPDEALAQLQDGRIRALLVARDLDLALRQCQKCGLATRAGDRTCAARGTLRQEISLAELLAAAVATQDVRVEFVNGEAAELLRRIGGLGGWLRVLRASAAD